MGDIAMRIAGLSMSDLGLFEKGDEREIIKKSMLDDLGKEARPIFAPSSLLVPTFFLFLAILLYP